MTESAAACGRGGRDRRAELALVVLLVLFALPVRSFPAPDLLDDAFITFRYARNLARGDGLVFNRGERVLGTTAPLWALLLAAGEVAGAGADRAGPAIATAAGALVTGLVFLLVRAARGGRLAAVLAALLWSTDPLAIRVERGGMEASLFVLAVLFVLWRAGASESTPAQRLTTGVVAGLSMLLRPEGVLAIAVLWVTRVCRRRPLGAELAGAVLPLALWSVAAQLYFGSPLPNTIAAKAAVHRGGGSVATAGLLGQDAGMFLAHAIPAPAVAVLMGLFAVAALTFVLVRDRWTGAGPLCLFTLAYAGAYIVAAPELFLWYHVPLAPGIAVAALAAASALSEGRSRLLRSAVAALLVVLVAGSVASGLGFLSPGEGGRSFLRLEPSTRERSYFQVASALRQLGASAATRVAAPEIGALGWALDDVPILDGVGLVSPEAILFARAAGGGRLAPGLLLALRPEWVVAPQALAREALADPQVQAVYVEVSRIAAARRIGGWVHLLRRRNLAAAPAPAPAPAP